MRHVPYTRPKYDFDGNEIPLCPPRCPCRECYVQFTSNASYVYDLNGNIAEYFRAVLLAYNCHRPEGPVGDEVLPNHVKLAMDFEQLKHKLP